MMGALLAALLGASWTLGDTELAHAQPYPNRPIRMPADRPMAWRVSSPTG